MVAKKIFNELLLSNVLSFRFILLHWCLDLVFLDLSMSLLSVRAELFEIEALTASRCFVVLAKF